MTIVDHFYQISIWVEPDLHLVGVGVIAVLHQFSKRNMVLSDEAFTQFTEESGVNCEF